MSSLVHTSILLVGLVGLNPLKEGEEWVYKGVKKAKKGNH